jgi:hypothetical protein
MPYRVFALSHPCQSHLRVSMSLLMANVRRCFLTGFIVATFNATSLFDDSVDRFKTTLTTLRAYDTTGGEYAI